jgi:fructokinase
MQNVIVGIGEILWDMLPSGKVIGGAPANFAYHAQELGESSIVVSCVGNDELGREIISSLEKKDMPTEFLYIDKSHPTGVVSARINKEGKPTYLIQEEVAWDYIPTSTLIRELAFKSAAVCFGTAAQRSQLSRMTIQTFVGLMEQDSIRVFDINLRQNFYSQDVIETSLSLANVLKLNVNELSVVKKLLRLNGDEKKILNELSRKYSLNLIALTRGREGSILFTEGKTSNHEGHKINVEDTVGAGDAFVAGLVTGMLRGYELDDLHNKANRVASYICSKHGATPSLTNEIRKLFK